MAHYYGITRSDEYLAHYGIKGMRWGVRKAIESGNSRKLDRAYRKAAKKLAKLEMRTNQNLQRKIYDSAKKRMVSGALGSAIGSAGLTASLHRGPVNNALRDAGIAGAAGLVGGALINSRGIGAGRFATDKGHAKAVAQRNEFRSAMKDAFKGTGLKVGSNSAANKAARSKAQTQLRRNREFNETIGDALKAGGIGALGGTGAANMYSANKIALREERRERNTGRTFNQLSAKEQRQVAQGMDKLLNRFEGHYQQGLSRGMNHVQAEAYANKQLNRTPVSKKRRRS